MNESDAQSEAADPTTSMGRLAELAQSHPQVRTVIAANPSTYEDLLSWLDQLGDPAVSAVIARRRAGLSPEVSEEPPGNPDQSDGRENEDEYDDQEDEPDDDSVNADADADDADDGVAAASARSRTMPLYTFAGNRVAGSVELRIYASFIEYEHQNYFVIVPFDRIETVTYSKRTESTYASVSIGELTFGCDNKEQVYAALREVLARRP